MPASCGLFFWLFTFFAAFLSIQAKSFPNHQGTSLAVLLRLLLPVQSVLPTEQEHF
uniref:Uncharacterized protein n=1 Tax=Siphoviridae sp. ctHzJ4 TaxID=2825426 RepID=A0A8S5U0T2_9CAUD|nr:MAG TPA: hypothetical protein [Siphoviridae sp. ctHzJ4]